MSATVSTIVKLVAAGTSENEILTAYLYLEREDIRAALLAAQHHRSRRNIVTMRA
ncbi:DUF433 domain-containing protein [Benzoatithermus flavus]